MGDDGGGGLQREPGSSSISLHHPFQPQPEPTYQVIQESMKQSTSVMRMSE